MKKFPCPPVCPDRRPACQGSCEIYKEWAAERKKEKAWLYKYQDADKMRAEHVLKVRRIKNHSKNK